MREGGGERAEGVDVVELGLHAKLARSRAPKGDVGLSAKLTFLHLRLRGADSAEERAQRDRVVPSLVGRAKVGLRDDLHQWHARAVKVDKGFLRLVQLVAPLDELARVLFEMHAADAHAAAVEIEVAADAHRQAVLADLVP